MTTRDRVIAALENCTDADKCKDCPWAPCEEFDYPHSHYPDDLIKKALELLKAEPKRGRWVPEEAVDGHWHWRCSECGRATRIQPRQFKYCPNCGAKMGVDA